jgi:hypothetical protein
VPTIIKAGSADLAICASSSKAGQAKISVQGIGGRSGLSQPGSNQDLRRFLRKRGIKPTIPLKRNDKKRKGRPVAVGDGYKLRWKIEAGRSSVVLHGWITIAE